MPLPVKRLVPIASGDDEERSSFRAGGRGTSAENLVASVERHSWMQN
ncbi:MAG: hypothetical protein OXN17_11830 [Candidatus Poribacteria bacterium]|nr:hypothetical protein [Candidatus Poribacteria bacterium]